MDYITRAVSDNSKKVSWHTYIALLFLIYLSSGFGMTIVSGTRILTWELLLFLYICVTKFNINLDRYKIPILCLGIALMSYIINGEPSKQILILASHFILAMAYCNSNKWEDTCAAYVKIMCVICLLSIVLYVINMIAPQLLSALPKVSNGNFELSTIFFSVSPRDNRNYGMFWEPGAFQTYIFLAFLIEVFHFKAKSKKRVIILIAALVTTFSTAGYITILIALIAVLLSGMTDNMMKKSTRNTIIIIVFGAILSYFIITNYYPKLAYTLFGKVQLYSHTQKGDSSTGVRVNAVVGAFSVFKENPFFGVGKTTLKSIFKSNYGYEMVTCTYANWFAFFGVFFGTLMLSGIYKFTLYFSQKPIVRFIIFIAFMASITSENYVMNPSILIWIFYGFAAKYEKFEIDKGQTYENIAN